MKKYIGVKIIKAEPMTRGLFNEGRQVFIHPNDPVYPEAGYKVVYEDGYESWSPKEVFEKAYREITSIMTSIMTFGMAIEALKAGVDVERDGWNGKGMHVTLARCSTIKGGIPIDNDCLLLFNVHGTYNTWVPSITDLLATDWRISK